MKNTELLKNKTSIDGHRLTEQTKREPTITANFKSLLSLICFLVFFFSMIMFFISVNELGLMMLLSFSGIIIGLISLSKTT
tara:strand:+ start:55 stop:297 length:243 start_codon:yes stop_codon:yes gene_type:complete